MPVTVWLAEEGPELGTRTGVAGGAELGGAGEADLGTRTGVAGGAKLGAGTEPSAGAEAGVHSGRAVAAESADRGPVVGLTVSSVLLSQGEPAMLAGLVSPDSDLVDALVANSSGRFVVHLLGGAHRRLAQHFSGELPAPADLLVTAPSTHGPVLQVVPDRIYCRMTASRAFGWSVLIEAEVEQTEVGEAANGLAWYHGTFHVLES
jgi:3-hydroxy-9,10-secoandrosta-1,3,5(10)-triene-9,17-dione monooxygenase reductase component